jgi:hypothetical protein
MRRLVAIVLSTCMLVASIAQASSSATPGDDYLRYEVPEHGFAVTVPEPPSDPGSEWFFSRLLGTMEDRPGLDRPIDDLAGLLPVDRDIVAALIESGEETGAVLMGAWWRGPDVGERTMPSEIWWIDPIPWVGATAEMIREAWVDSGRGMDAGRETGIVEVPGGEAVYIHEDIAVPGDWDVEGSLWSQTTYYLTDGSMVLVLTAASDTPPEDRWLSFLETVEFLPAEE